MHRLFVVLLVAGVLVLNGKSAVAAQGDDAATDPSLGTAVPYVGPEGDEVATITVTDLVDPFSEYDPNTPPERGNHYVLVDVVVENTGQRPFQLNPSGIVLQDADGFLYSSGFVSRGDAEDTTLQFQDIPAGASVEGDLIFTVFNNVELVRVLFQPESDRLLILADLRLTGEPTDEPPTAEPAEPTVTDEPIPPADATAEPPPIDDATAEPSDTTEPPPAETPAASVSVSAADCEGLDPWLADTRARVDRAVAIDEDVTALGDQPDAAARDTIRGFAAEFAVFAKQQRETTAPPIAETDNDTLVQSFADAAQALGDVAAALDANDPDAVSLNLTIYRSTALFIVFTPSILDQFARDCGAQS